MILGIGIDICQVERIRLSISRLGQDWIDLVFSVEEQRNSRSNADPAARFARSFSGKEACAKALGSGFADGVGWHEVEIVQARVTESVRLSGSALQRLQQITPAGFKPNVHITTSGNGTFAQAFVIVSADLRDDKSRAAI
jgi:holo-[acyl-carrier protein] synthase